MDVYLGFGLLSAGVVVVVCMFFDGWLKRRNPRKSQFQDNNNRFRDPEFGLNTDDSELNEHFNDDMDSVSPSYVVYDVSHKTKSSSLADLCDSKLEVNTILDKKQYAVAEEDVSLTPSMVEQRDDAPKQFYSKPIEKNKEVYSDNQEKNKAMPANLLILSIMAKKGNRFESYDLFQAISAAGMQFGEMNIFHYYQPTPVGKVTLFSLASASKPGDFDLNHIAEFSCMGLMLFMDIGNTPDPQHAFKLMLETAERLTEDLDGELCADPMTAWNEKLAWQYHQKIMQFKTASKQDSKNCTNPA